MNLLSSASIFSFYTLISRILGYLRDILIATFLGASIYADAFFVAFRLPNTFRRLFAEGVFNAAFIPSYTEANLKSEEESKKFADDVYDGFKERALLPKVNSEILDRHENKMSALVTMYNRAIRQDSLIFILLNGQTKIINKLDIQVDENKKSIEELASEIKENTIELASR